MTHNESLIILKIEKKKSEFISPIIEYEVYNPTTKTKLNLNLCNGTKIEFLIPVSIDENNLFKYNTSSRYYNDLCFTYTTEEGTDIILKDRRLEYINKNMMICEKNCEYEAYNFETKKAKCKCKVKENLNLIPDFGVAKEKLKYSFLNIKNNINLNVMKCYILLFSKEGLIKNIGSYILLIILLLNVVLLLLFIFKGYDFIFKLVKKMVEIKKINGNKKKISNKKIHSTTKIRKSKTLKNKKIIKDSSKRISNSRKINFLKNNPPKNKKIKINIGNIYVNNIKQESYAKLNLKNNIDDTSKNTSHKNKLIIRNNLISKKSNKSKNKIEEKLNDYELNNLKYKNALKLDKRKYFQYYISLLKRKQILIFTFCTKDDYNSKIIKITLFLFSFSLNCTINALFFNDSTMHKIYEEEGSFNFIYQIPKILLSTIITAIINALVLFLSLTEKNILKIKNNKNETKNNLDSFMKCLKIKFAFYFILDFIFLLFFWYYLACFCAVYKNTQSHLILDTLISILLSFLYPFVFSLLPAIIRIQALNSKKGDKECFYKISKFLQIIF